MSVKSRGTCCGQIGSVGDLEHGGRAERQRRHVALVMHVGAEERRLAVEERLQDVVAPLGDEAAADKHHRSQRVKARQLAHGIQ